ncbi:hypothetical protein POJ06DRAFT_222156 [Lipomyces tetrasporus]|uniref:Zn(2)-C6 fungal-type domain-containing protein n=1 Tax=Lipomyces tetrasporus TaxID=54092 RepID=A0AAD7QUG3_9ASCO|nr:uncharacterized protein POJ06DRAFT_222156 [Lipomyces tetrasporus]KAJ8101609.1 hypothetical protein POJ06DRAFT_222156 [Lipomyces tetrasporus]
MVRRVGRSRGCRTCRRRKIKCDERIPHCSQCLESSLPCPGALVGNVFLDMTQDLATRYGVNKGFEFKTTNTCNIVFVNEQAPYDPRKHNQYFTSKRHRSPSSAMPPEFQPSSLRSHFSLCGPLLEQQFLEHFIYSLLSTPGGSMLKKWMTQLPDLISRENLPTLKYAILAASMVLCGSLEGDKAIQLEACRWYLAGLESQQKELLRLKKAVSDGAICATMLLSFYESIRSTSSEAWMYHMCASSRLVELRGPEGWGTGLAHELFCALRLYMVYVSTAKRQPSFLATELWLSTPFCEHPKSHFDRLLDIHTVIPIYLSQVDDIVSLRENGQEVITPLDLRVNLLKISSALQAWKTEYVRETCNHRDICMSSEDLSHNEGIEESTRSSTLDSSLYHDPFTAETIALYDSCCILVAQMFLAISPPSLKTAYNNVIISHASSILLAVTFINHQHDHQHVWNNAVGPFRLLHPLKVVATSTPCPQQREYARNVLHTWELVLGLEGVGILAGCPI